MNVFVLSHEITLSPKRKSKMLDKEQRWAASPWWYRERRQLDGDNFYCSKSNGRYLLFGPFQPFQISVKCHSVFLSHKGLSVMRVDLGLQVNWEDSFSVHASGAAEMFISFDIMRLRARIWLSLCSKYLTCIGNSQVTLWPEFLWGIIGGKVHESCSNWNARMAFFRKFF